MLRGRRYENLEYLVFGNSAVAWIGEPKVPIVYIALCMGKHAGDLDLVLVSGWVKAGASTSGGM